MVAIPVPKLFGTLVSVFLGNKKRAQLFVNNKRTPKPKSRRKEQYIRRHELTVEWFFTEYT